MKPATPALIALLNAAGGAVPFYEWDFFTFTLQDGTQLRYGTAGFTIAAASSAIWDPPALDGSGGMWFAGISWPPSLMGARSSYGEIGHWRLGLDADSFTLEMAPRLVDPITGEEFPDQINGMPFLQACRAGALDGADCIVSTAYYDAQPSAPIPPVGASPVGTLVITRGLVGAVDVSDSTALISVTDYRALLSQQMPRNLYQAGCRHRLFDSRCTLDAAAYSAAGVVQAASSTSVTSSAAIAAPGGSGTFAMGVMTVTSGDNAGFKRFVVSWDGAQAFKLLNPFPYSLAAGSTFTVTAGCDKRLATCEAFGNEANFGGEPFIPVPEVAIG